MADSDARPDAQCDGCRPEKGEYLDWCQVHGICEGCDVQRGYYSRVCPKHGILAEERRAFRALDAQSEAARDN